MFFFDARIFTLVVEYCGCVKRRPDYGSGNIEGCRRVIWLLVSSWQRGPVCRQHQGRDGSIVVASEVRFSWLFWHGQSSTFNCRVLTSISMSHVSHWAITKCNPVHVTKKAMTQANYKVILRFIRAYDLLTEKFGTAQTPPAGKSVCFAIMLSTNRAV